MIHHTSNDANNATVEQLLEIEKLCDAFELTLENGTKSSFEDFMESVPPPLRGQVRPHLEAILESRNQGDSQTTSPARELPWPDTLGNTTLPSHDTLVDERFQIEFLLGRGGTGTVWKALDLRTGQSVALKLAHDSSEQLHDRLERETQNASRLDHSNIPSFIASGSLRGARYVVTEYIQGMSLAESLRIRSPNVEQSVKLVRDLAEIVSYAHSQGVVHRDLKPHNILLDQKDTVYVTDFGHARMQFDEQRTLTLTGEIVGTPSYMAPEQASGDSRAADHRADIYSMGVILYRLLTGNLPFQGGAESLIYQILHIDAPPASSVRADVPPELSTLCAKCLEKAPHARLQTADDLAKELERYLRREPIHTRAQSNWSKIKKWAQRRPGTAATLSLGLVSLISITIVASVAAFLLGAAYENERELRTREQQARQLSQKEAAKARSETARARSEAIQSQQIEDFLVSLFEANDPVSGLLLEGRIEDRVTPELDDVIDRGVQMIDSEGPSNPLTRARLMEALAQACHAAGKFTKAQQLLNGALELRTSASIPPTASERIQARRGDLVRARILHDLGQFEKAEQHYQTLCESLGTEEDTSALLRSDTLFFWGKLKLDQRKNDDARTLLEECLQLRKARLSKDSRKLQAVQIALSLCDGFNLHESSSLVNESGWLGEYQRLAFELQQARSNHEFGKAIPQYKQLLDRLRHHLGTDHVLTLLATGDFAGLLYESGDLVGAYEAIEPVLARAVQVAPQHPKVIDTQLRLADELSRSSRFDEADQLYRQIEDVKGSLANCPEEALLGSIWTGFVLGNLERSKECAEILLSRPNQMAIQTAWNYYAYARVLEALGDPAAAVASDRTALTEAQKVTTDSQSAAWLERTSVILMHNDQIMAAEAMLRRAIEVEQEKRFEDHPRVARYKASLAACLRKQGRMAESAGLLSNVLQIYRASLPPNDHRINEVQRHLSNFAQQSAASDR